MRIEPKFSNQTWSIIFSSLYTFLNTSILLTFARVSKQFKTLLSENKFWSTFVNKNYKYCKCNIYDSIFEHANIIHRMTIFLEKHKNDKHARCILSDVKFNDTLYNKQQQKYEINKFKSIVGNYDDIDMIQYNETCALVTVEYTDFCAISQSSTTYISLWVHNKFLPESDCNKTHRINNYIVNDDIYFSDDFTLHGNYFWYFHIENGIKIYVYNIFTFQTILVYEYNWSFCKTVDSTSRFYWSFTHTEDGLLTLIKSVNELDLYKD